MNILQIKFFQAIQVKGTHTYDTIDMADATKFTIELDNGLIRVYVPGTGEKTLTSMQNVRYMRIKDNAGPETPKGSRGASKAQEVSQKD